MMIRDIEKRIVKKEFHTGYEVETVTIQESDFEYLKEQAERVQKLEEIKSDAIKQIDVTQERNERLENRVQELEDKLARIRFVNNDYDKQNKRYREALEFINEELELVLHSNKGLAEKMFYIENSKRKITEALEGECE